MTVAQNFITHNKEADGGTWSSETSVSYTASHTRRIRLEFSPP